MSVPPSVISTLTARPLSLSTDSLTQPTTQPEVRSRSATITSLAQARLTGEHTLPEPAPLTGRVSVGQGEATVALQRLPGSSKAEQRMGVFDLNHPKVNGGKVHVANTALPASLTGDALVQARQEVQNKINRGCQLLDQVLSGHPPPGPCTDKQMTDLMWAVHTMAEAKVGSNWVEGAYSLEDPNGRLRAFLDSNTQAYQRLSTHVSGFQGNEGGAPRGIDGTGGRQNPVDMDRCLPNGHGTLLYQSMGVQDTDKARGMPSNRLLLKLEPYGAYSSSLNKPERAALGPTRPKNQHDGGSFIGHVGTTIRSLWQRLCGNNSPEGTFKERISGKMEKAYGKMTGWRSSLPGDIKGILKRDNPTSTAGGLRIMNRNIADAIATLRAGNLPDKERHIQTLQGFMTTHVTSDPRLDHLECRIGAEVIFDANDLHIAPEAPDAHQISLLAQRDIGRASNLGEAVRAYDTSPTLENAMQVMQRFCPEDQRATNRVYQDFLQIAVADGLARSGLAVGEEVTTLMASYTPEKLANLFHKPWDSRETILRNLHQPQNAPILGALRQSAERHLVPENIDFLHDVGQFMAGAKTTDGLRNLVDTYIRPGSPKQVNISAEQQGAVTRAVAALGPDPTQEALGSVLNSAFTEVYGLTTNIQSNPLAVFFQGLPSDAGL